MSRSPRRGLFRLALGRSTAREDADEEVDSHLALSIDELVAEGLSPDAARAEALRRFGDLGEIRRSLAQIDRGAERAGRRSEWLGGILADVRQALRGLRRNPGFALATTLTLGLGIGLDTAIFSVYRGVVLQPPPFVEPDRIVRVWSSQLDRRLRLFSISIADFRDWQAQSRTVGRLAAYQRQEDMILSGSAEPELILGARVSADLFSLLGTQPRLGRLFSAEEDRPGAAGRPLLISYGVWQQRFGGNPAALGQVLTLNGEARTIIGVMPARFVLPGNPAELWIPLGGGTEDQGRGNRFLRVLGRLAPGASLESARLEFATITRRLQAQYPGTNTGWTVTMLSLTDAMVGESFHSALEVLLGAVALVLLIACANVATMVLGRNVARSRELAVRASLGAGAGRLGRLLLTEGLVLGGLGGILGAGLAFGLVRLLHALDPATLPRLEDVHVNGTVLGVAALLAAGSGILCGLVPLHHALRRRLSEALREGGRGTSGGRKRQRAQRTLVVAQLTLAILLLSGAGLLIRSLYRLQRVELGFDAHRVFAASLTLPAAGYPDRGRVALFYEHLLRRVRAIPGVREAAAVSSVPLSGNNSGTVFAIEGRPLPDPKSRPDADYRIVTPGYFALMAIPLLHGRDFTEHDDSAAAPVTIISETTARRFWPGEEALGSRIRIGDVINGTVAEVIGVVGDVRHLTLLSPEHRPLLYFPLRRTGLRGMTVLARTAGDPATLTASFRAELHAVDPAQPLGAVRTLDEVVGDVYSPQRFNVIVLGLFALTALALAAIGLYGVMAYAVRQRTHELCVRIALGANQGRVLRMVLGESLRLIVAGIVLGLGGALLLNQTLTALLFGVEPGDPFALAVACLVLLGIALFGSYLPARRAAQVDPMETLRGE